MQWSLSEGAGSRRLGEVRTRAAIQLLLVQACGEIFHVHSRRLAPDAVTGILDVVRQLADHARQVDKDMGLRRQLAAAQAHDKVQSPLMHRIWQTCIQHKSERRQAAFHCLLFPFVCHYQCRLIDLVHYLSVHVSRGKLMLCT